MWHRISTADLTYLYDTLKSVGVERAEDLAEELESAIEITEEALNGPTSAAFDEVTGTGSCESHPDNPVTPFRYADRGGHRQKVFSKS